MLILSDFEERQEAILEVDCDGEVILEVDCDVGK